jgi:hypothetical protein
MRNTPMQKRKNNMAEFDPKFELEMSKNINEARESVKKLAGTADRIQQIVTEGAVTPLQNQRVIQQNTFSMAFISFILVLMIVLLGLFGILFIQYTKFSAESMAALQKQVSVLQSKVQESTTVPPPPASRSSTTSQ